MAFTFLKAKGYNIGNSLCEEEYLEFCIDILNKYKDKIILPIDVVVSKEISDKEYATKNVDSLDNDDIGLDIGNNTINMVKKTLSNTKTVFWNGPLGYYELECFQIGSKEILKYLIDKNIKTILGGGDIVACSSKLGLKDKVYHASTGGGATLEYLEGKELPGLKVIQNKE